jgi:hypothetical protein
VRCCMILTLEMLFLNSIKTLVIFVCDEKYVWMLNNVLGHYAVVAFPS